MRNILFLADPNSVHDLKWISYFTSQYTCFLVARKHHLESWRPEDYESFRQKYGVTIVGALEDFSLRHFLRTLKEWDKLKALLDRHRIDIFHIMYAEPNALWCFFRPAKSPIYWLLTTRGTDILKAIPAHAGRKDLLNRTIAWMYRRALKQFDKITCTSHLQKENVWKLAPGSPVEIIRTGVEAERILADNRSHLPEELNGVRYVLFPRNMRPLYNHEFSLAAIRLLPQAIKAQYCFVFVDQDSSDTAYVKKIRGLMDQDPEARFLFLNRQRQESIWEMYKGASAVVMNPLSDGAPVSAMEAMLCGTPVIVSNLAYDPDIFDNTILKLSSWEPAELARTIGEVLEGRTAVNKDLCTGRILERGNRATEMKKLGSIYAASASAAAVG
ncbi:glycosyltransferase family 4 protein [Paraflavisolibacter sp. H34]|uniref:glycosyltransferase family 4 protein n=1 Tax=Huijunlia imazamoxiresistens TaxID=3127457 RepID=UPI003019918F